MKPLIAVLIAATICGHAGEVLARPPVATNGIPRTSSQSGESAGERTSKVSALAKELNVQAVTAAALRDAYNENASLADKKYKGKWLLIDGRIETVFELVLQKPGTYGVLLDQEIGCQFQDDQQGAVGHLTKGTNVLIHGNFEGRLPNNLLRMKNCSLETLDIP